MKPMKYRYKHTVEAVQYEGYRTCADSIVEFTNGQAFIDGVAQYSLKFREPNGNVKGVGYLDFIVKYPNGLIVSISKQEFERDYAPVPGNGGWRTIESAPLDDTMILMYSAPFFSWDNGSIELGSYRRRGRKFRNKNGTEIEPTHWQPLPAPPTTEPSKET